MANRDRPRNAWGIPETLAALIAVGAGFLAGRRAAVPAGYNPRNLAREPDREYNVSCSPVVMEPAVLERLDAGERRALLLGLYGEVCNNWRALTDVRFKLLAIVPTLTGLALIPLLTRARPEEPQMSAGARMILVGLGLAVTVFLRLYDRRNTQIYDDLVGRGRMLEYQLGLHTGQFLGRPRSFSFWRRHDFAIGGIYWTAILGWALAGLTIAGGGYGPPFRSPMPAVSAPKASGRTLQRTDHLPAPSNGDGRSPGGVIAGPSPPGGQDRGGR